MVWAWMHWSPCARGPRTSLWFGHGCTGHRVLVDQKRHYGLGMDALVTGARGPETSLWFGHGCTGHRVLVDHEHYYGLGMDALVTVCSRTTNVIMVWAWMHWSPCAREPRTLLWFGHGCTGHRVLVNHERYYGLGMDALVTVCSWTTNVIMVWAWMHWSLCARGPRTSLWFGHGCTGHRVLVDHERHYGLDRDALVTGARGPETSLWFGHGCTGHCVLVYHERYYG